MGEISLDDLGLSFGTDKSSWGHDYLRFYEDYFRKFRRENIVFLEIGVAGGASLRVWRSYFSQAKIIGADINPESLRFRGNGISIEILDQSSIEDLTKLAINYGPFDIVIDDGSHMWEHQIVSLKTLFPFLKNGGIYVVEDLQTNFGSMQDRFRGVSEISCFDYLKRLAEIRVGNEQIDLSKEKDVFAKSYAGQMKNIIFYQKACLLIKGKAGKEFDAPLRAEDSEPACPISILAHIGAYGDRTCDCSTVRGRGASQNIQGFSILSDDVDLRKGLSYRALSPDKAWTNWMPLGKFVGQRGARQDLHGFSLRLSEDCRRLYKLEFIGAFRNTLEYVAVNDGEDCVSAADGSALYGMQIVLQKRT
jgi:hypothetical protein